MLTAYCERLPEDTLLLITAGKLSKDGLKTRWCQALDKAGVVIQVWPLEGQDLNQWLQQRMQRRGLQADTAGLQLLASRIEGNLLRAAAQEIEKLYVLYGAGQLSHQQISDVVADSSRYDVLRNNQQRAGDRCEPHVQGIVRLAGRRHGRAGGAMGVNARSSNPY